MSGNHNWKNFKRKRAPPERTPRVDQEDGGESDSTSAASRDKKKVRWKANVTPSNQASTAGSAGTQWTNSTKSMGDDQQEDDSLEPEQIEEGNGSDRESSGDNERVGNVAIIHAYICSFAV